MKRALIVANLAGFASFLISDIMLLQEKGYQVVFAANENKLEWEDTKERLHKLNVLFMQVDFDSQKPFSKSNVKAFKQLARIIKNDTYQLIHCHTPIAGCITRFIANKYRKKGTCVVYTTHGFAFTNISSKKTWITYYTLEKVASKFCDAIITINNEDFENAKKMWCRKVFLINGVGVDTEKYSLPNFDRNAYRKKIGIPDNKIMILSVGELSTRKNHQIIIKAIGSLPNKERYIYVICGNGIDGGTEKKLKELADKEGVDLLLLGFRFDIPEITNCSDIGAIPSTREGLGLAGIQSLAAGVPVIGSCVQGIKDYVVDNITGYLSNPFDVQGFKDSIEKLEKLSEKRKVQMHNACINMAEKYDIKVSSSQMRGIYEELDI